LPGPRRPRPLRPLPGALILTLCDGTTPLHLAPSHDTEALRGWITFHTGAPLVGAEAAAFALGTWEALQPWPIRHRHGGISRPLRHPDRGDAGAGGDRCARLTGPGIETEARLSLPEIAAFQANRARFPLGFDCFFTCGDRVAGLPRSTRVQEG
jgi:alpha-D-ribose 1-methylphosphonate 5-triphosphate synthase subunit PhnH